MNAKDYRRLEVELLGGFVGVRPGFRFRDEPHVIVLGHGQTVADPIPRRDSSRDVPWLGLKSIK